MSALPPFHHFRQGLPLEESARHAEGSFEDAPHWDEPDGEQENWHYTRAGEGYTDSSGTQVYPRTFRMALIGTLALLCWAMVLALGHMVAGLLH